MSKEIINTPNAPSAIGPYSQAVKVGGLLLVSGQIPLNPKNQTLVSGTIKEETIQVLDNIKAIIKEANIDMNSIVKTSIFLTSMDFFDEVNEVYGLYFKQPYPARETLAVQNLPKSVRIEISVIAKL